MVPPIRAILVDGQVRALHVNVELVVEAAADNFAIPVLLQMTHN